MRRNWTKLVGGLIAFLMVCFIGNAMNVEKAIASEMFEEKKITGKTLTSGTHQKLVVKKDGSLWAWGSNKMGTLGDGTLENRKYPVKIMNDVAVVEAGTFLSLAIKNDNSLWAWGDYSVMCTEKIIVNKPKKILDDVVSVSVGAVNIVAVKKDGSLWVSGKNTSDQFLGNDYGGKISDFTKVMDGVKAADIGYFGTIFVIKEDDTLWGWGANMDGLLQDNVHELGAEPIKAPKLLMKNVVAVSIDDTHVAVIKKDGSLWTWGNNSYNQLGTGRHRQKASKTPKCIDNDVVYVSCAGQHTAYVKKDGSLWVVGSLYGEGFCYLGIPPKETIMDSLEPVKAADNVIAVNGDGCNLFLKKDGTVWGWGSRLGHDLPKDQREPVKLMSGAAFPK